ncbi:MAG: inorganic phosphate transporter [Granulosicoccus sp.]
MTTAVKNTKTDPGSISTRSFVQYGFVLPRYFVAAIFLVLVGGLVLLKFGLSPMSLFIAIASVAGGYMAINIGANDVANNVGPAVGSGALSLGTAIAIAVVFESAGALLAGGDVVSTISKGIIDPSMIPNTKSFLMAMGAALLAGALWLNLATWVGAPVSTTHSIVGGVLGGGIAAAGLNVVDWGVMSKIGASWVISPVLGGVIAASFLAGIEKTVFSKSDMIAASRRWVPVFLSVMVSAFTMYLIMKGLKKVWKPDMWVVMLVGLGAFILSSFALRPFVTRAAQHIGNRRASVNQLFNIPLIFSAALLSFSHGANDVANAVGPLSAIVSAASESEIAAKVGIPIWVMIIGAIGISIGLLLFGAKLIRTVGKQLTSLDQTRAFCVCLSAAITVIGASAMGLPVSSTHIAIGSVFGIGFFREFRCNRRKQETTHSRKPRKLVRRKQLLTICAAWFITVPMAALLSATLYFVAQGATG